MVRVAGAQSTQIVRTFGNYTCDLQALGQWLQEQGVESPAMESTGMYWIPLFETLEAHEKGITKSQVLRLHSLKKLEPNREFGEYIYN